MNEDDEWGISPVRGSRLPSQVAPNQFVSAAILHRKHESL